jgi:hypothetical protein
MADRNPIAASPVPRRGKRSGPCKNCGVYRNTLIRDRIVPGYLGGTYTAGNIQLLCANCHQDKTELEQAAVNRGRSHSPEVKAKISAALQGRAKSPEMRSKISATLREQYRLLAVELGTSTTPKIKRARYRVTGKRWNLSEETRQKMSVAQKKAWETRKNRSLSPEARAKISATLKEQHKAQPRPRNRMGFA